MASKNTTLLSSLLPPSTPYLLGYTIPLLLVSIITTFAGAFLTLDRTRTFAPIDGNAQPEHDEEHGLVGTISAILDHYRSAGVSDESLGRLKRTGATGGQSRGDGRWRLEGGVGGVMIGWLCGVHLSTYLALLITNRTSASPLQPVHFLVTWIFSSTTLAVISGRWLLAAQLFAAMTGGASFTVLLSVIFYPTFTARLVIAAVFIVILIVVILLPLKPVRHSGLRTAAALTGSFGLVSSIALLKTSNADVSESPVGSWANAWLVLVVANVVGHRGSMEKGLSAAMILVAACGAVADWFAKTKFGENPDKEWDKYLADFSKQLPLRSDRQGTFKPFTSFWARLFHPKAKEVDDKATLLPQDSQLLSKDSHLDPSSSKTSPSVTTRALPPAPSFRPLPNRKTSTRSMLVKARPTRESSDYSDDSSEDDEKSAGPPKFRPYIPKRSSTTTTGITLVAGVVPNTPKKTDAYPDEEEDLAAARRSTDATERDGARNSPGWKPAFLRATTLRRDTETSKIGSDDSHSTAGRRGANSDRRTMFRDVIRSESPAQMSETSSGQKSLGGHREAFASSPTHLKQDAIYTSQLPVANTLLPPGSVPVTPSLLKAIDRINVASQAAYRPPASPSPPALSPHRKSTQDGQLPSQESLTEDFWEAVRRKAGDVDGMAR